MNEMDKVNEWLETLNPKDVKKAALSTIERLMEIEEIKILDANYGPFWDRNGKSIIEVDDNFPITLSKKEFNIIKQAIDTAHSHLEEHGAVEIIKTWVRNGRDIIQKVEAKQ